MKNIKGHATDWLAGVAAILALAAHGSAAAQAITAIWSSPSTGVTQLRQSPESSITMSADRSRLSLTMRSLSSTSTTVASAITFDAPTLQGIAPGIYENLRSYYPQPRQGALSYSATGESCYGYEGSKATVLEALYDGNTLVRFAADFEVRCDYYPAATTTFVEVRINSTVPLMMNRPAGWTTPDPVAFANRTFVQPGSPVLSQSVTIWGINAPAPISVSGGEYSINDGPFTAAAGTVNAKDRVRLLVTGAAVNASTSAQLNVGAMSATFTAFSETTGVPVTVLRADGTPGDMVLAGGSINIPSPDWRIVANSSSRQGVAISATHPNGDYYNLALLAPQGLALAVGAYEQTGNSSSSTTRGTLSFSSRNRSCTNDGGRFVVLDIEFDSNNLVTRLAADFEQRCGSAGVQYGEIRYNSALPFSFQEGPGSASPDVFAFTPVAAARAGQWVQSNEISVLGINVAATIQVSGGEYSVNGGPYTAATATVLNHDRVRVRVMSPGTAGASAVASLTIADRSAPFAVRTYAVGDVLSALHLEGVTAVDVVTPDGIISPSSGISKQYASFYVTTPSGLQIASISFQARSGSTIEPGIYEMANPNLPGSPAILVAAGNCYSNSSSSRFVVHEAVWGANGTVDRFAADFTVWCNGSPIHGELRYRSSAIMLAYKPANSTVPNGFAFIPQGPLAGGTRATSNRVTIYGINTSVPITISGGEYRLNGGAFTSQPGTAVNGDEIVLRASASYSAGATQTATLNVGGGSATFSVRTYTVGEPLTGLDVIGPPPPLGAPRTFMAPYHAIGATSYSNQRYLQLYASDGVGDALTLSLEAPVGSVLATGTVVQIRNYADSQYGSLGTSGNNLYCAGTRTGEFVIRDLAYDTNGNVARLAVDLWWACDGTNPAFRGEFRYKSVFPFSRFMTPTLNRKRAGFDANNDGRNDILHQHSDGRAAMWLMDGPYTIGAANLVPAGTGWSIALQGDFDGDGKSDLLWKHTDGRVAIWLMNGSTLTSAATLIGAGTGWFPKLVADFNGDGKSDILWEHTDGRTAMWLMNGTALTAAATLIGAGTGWSATLAGDLNGDRRADILWTHVDGRPSIWLMNGTQMLNGGVLFTAGTGWSAKLLADLNGDGRDDIVWWNTDGRVSVWLMNGMSAQGVTQVMNAGNPYVPEIAGDINGDGKADIVWRAVDGSAIFWLMDGAAQVGGAQVLTAGSGWTVTRVADFSGDMIGDLLLTHTDGRVRMDLFDGLGFTASSILLNAGTGWTPVPIR